MTNIFLDLDGTLIDSSRRLYDLFQKLVPQSCLTYEDYWKFKHNKVNHLSILTEKFGYTIEEFQVFEKDWMGLIETEDFLNKDIVFDGVKDTLIKLKEDKKLYLITSRQSIEAAYKQLKYLGLYAFFDDVCVTQKQRSKEYLIMNNFKVSKNDYMIGDTGYDILTGKKVGIKTIAASYGFLSREILEGYKPDFIIDDFREILTLM
jgi:phosphoglycolate phosphatase